MTYSDDDLDVIYLRNSGKCHLCGKKLARKNYAAYGERGAWEVDHSVARARGGGDHGNNLRAACIACNRSKQAVSSRTVRTANGLNRSPMSPTERERAKSRNALKAGAAGAAIGAAIGGPPGAVIGGIIGGIVGDAEDPED